MKFKVYPVAEKPLTESKLKGMLKGSTIEERLFTCECGSNDYILLPTWSEVEKENPKKHIICLHCTRVTHL
jgi:hypothetical protein